MVSQAAKAIWDRLERKDCLACVAKTVFREHVDAMENLDYQVFFVFSFAILVEGVSVKS